MSYEDWQASMAPKVQGTWNLHEAVSREDLGYFVLFGSVVGLCGNAGQTNYAAANTFLEGFSRYRRRLGLPSSVLVLGAVGEVGLISRQPKLLQSMQAVGTWLLDEDEVLKGLEICIMRSHDPIATVPGIQTSSSVIIGLGYTRPLSDASVRLLWHSQDARFAPYANIDSSFEQRPSEASSNILRDLTIRADRDPSIMLTEESRSLIIQETVRLVSSSLIGSQDLDEGQKWEIPIDSLASLEIKSWVRRNMNLDVSVAEIAKSRTVGGLALMTADRLVGHYKAKLENPSSGVLDEGTASPFIKRGGGLVNSC